MKNKKILNLIIIILLLILTQVPNMAYNFYFSYNTENLPIVCNYILTSIAWIISICYIIYMLLVMKNKNNKN